jgi:uncharacterized SAM-binding protein YcdF (DUF218 family)
VRRGVFSKPRREGGRIARRIIARVVVVAAILAWVLTAGRWLAHTSNPNRADAVFFLADFEDREGALRTATIFERVRAKRVIVFVASGKAARGRSAVRVLRSHGVPASDIRTVGPVHGTDDEAKVAADLVSRCNWRSVALVTAPYHTRRAGFLFRRAVEGRAHVAPVSTGERYPASSWFLHARSASQTLLEWGRLLLDGRYVVQTPLAKGTRLRC